MFHRLLTGRQRFLPLCAMRVPTGAKEMPAAPSASPPSLLQHCRLQHNDDRSTVKVLNKESDSGLMVDAFSQVGFRLNNGLSVVGPVALFPKTVLSWKVKNATDINEDSLSLFYLLEPKIDLLILGVGDKGTSIDMKVMRFLRQKGINMEILPTESACTTFNFLNQEGRYVAAGLLPPTKIRVTDDDFITTQQNKRRLFQVSPEDDD